MRGTALAVLWMISVFGIHTAAGADTQLPAFPGAEGFGAAAVGGRGGRVIKVTNLDADGPGSLQAACEAKGPRIVVFEVSGVIRGDIRVPNSFLTIAGQTAPGAGVTIEGMLQAAGRNQVRDVIVRFVRLRPPHRPGHSGDAVQMGSTRRVILDHCSLSWAVDETIDIIRAYDWTVQWCTVEESDPRGHSKGVPHNYGFLAAYAGTGNISLHHNLFAHHYRRAPSLTPYEANSPGDFRNNVVYDVYGGFSNDGHARGMKNPVNLIGNWYARGPGCQANRRSRYHLYPFGIEGGEPGYYIAGNYIDEVGYVGDPRDPDWKVPRWVQWNRNGTKLDRPASVAPVTTHSAKQAFALVLAQAGCLPRDRVTRRTIADVKNRTGKWGRNAPDELSDEWFLEGLKVVRPPEDLDNDGMPDAWEQAHGLSPDDPADANKIVPAGATEDDRHRGYTCVEFYLNQLADRLIGDAVRQAASQSTNTP